MCGHPQCDVQHPIGAWHGGHGGMAWHGCCFLHPSATDPPPLLLQVDSRCNSCYPTVSSGTVRQQQLRHLCACACHAVPSVPASILLPKSAPLSGRSKGCCAAQHTAHCTLYTTCTVHRTLPLPLYTALHYPTLPYCTLLALPYTVNCSLTCTAATSSASEGGGRTSFGAGAKPSLSASALLACMDPHAKA